MELFLPDETFYRHTELQVPRLQEDAKRWEYRLDGQVSAELVHGRQSEL